MPKSLRAAFAVLVALVVGVPAASAAGSPSIALVKSAPAKQPIGIDSTVSLTASNPNGQPNGYNVSFRDVLPAGVHYVAGSAAPAPDPQIVANKPSNGQTTLLFTNLADLSPGSTFTVTFKVAHDTSGGSALRVGDSFTNSAGAFIQTDPRVVPKFDGNGVPISSSFTGSATASATTTLVPFIVQKDEPSPEGELLRGAHDHQTVYTITVTNNKIHATTGIQVDDYLPAGLEFLGCGNVDSTTNAPTNPGSNREYPGASALSGHVSSPSQCLTATSVETVQTDPDGAGPLPNAVYTHVVWSLGDLAANAIGRIRYVAAIPARSNTLDWNGSASGNGSAPSPTSLGQAANLDNNGGPELRDEAGLTNYVVGTGTYTGPVRSGTANPASVDTSLTRTSEDLRILKSSDKGGIAHGDITKWSLTLDTSEYRSVTGITVTDTVPNGLCPLGNANFEHTPPTASSECNPAGVFPSISYSGSPVENADGTWKVTFKPADLPVNGHAVITFPTRTRAHYQKNFQDDTEVLANDDWQNTVHTDGTNHTRTVNGQPIDHDASYDGVTIIDDSQSGQAASGTSVEKFVSKSGVASSAACPTSTSSYTKDSAQAQDYGPGDVVCYRIRIQFSSTVDTKIDPITDFLPASEDYVTGSTIGLPGNTVPGSLTATVSGQTIQWAGVGDPGTPAGTRIVKKHSPAYVFDVVFKAAISRPNTQTPGDLVDNLAKFSNRNTPNASFPSRADVDHGWSEAQLALTKGVKTIKRGSTTIEGPNGPNVDHRPVLPGDIVTWRVDVTNAGNRDAKAAEVWDALPPKVVCADVSNISNGGTCSNTLVGGKPGIKWTGIDVAKGKSVERDFDLVVKKDVFAPGEELDNKAGVRTYTTTTDTGTTFTYIPASNIDSTLSSTANTVRADDVSDVFIPGDLVVKGRTTDVKEPGNRGPGDSPDDQATIGENVNYTVTATLPANTILNTGLISDAIPAGLVLDTASVTAKLDGAALPAGWSLSTTATSIAVSLPPTFTVGSTKRVVTVTFRARVADVPGNVAGTVITNVAQMTWTDSKGNPQASNSAKIPTTVVEPKIAVVKAHDGPSTVGPGTAITFHVTATNGTGANVSRAHDLTFVDTLPIGFCVVPGTVTDGGVVAGACNALKQTITWTLAQLDPGQSHVFTYQATVPSPVVAGSALTNTVAETASSLGGTPPGERAYTASASDTVTATSPTIAKTVVPPTVTNGQGLTYTIAVTLPPNLQLLAAHIDDALPAGVAFDKQVSGTCTPSCGFTVPTTPTSTAGPISWSLGDVPSAPSARTVTIVYGAHVTAGAADGKQTNTATLAWKSSDSKDQSISTTATTTVGHPVVRLNKHVSCDGTTVPVADTDGDTCAVVPGAPETYSIVVRNDGDRPAYDIQVVDTPDPALTNITAISNGGALAAGKITWTLPGPLGPGDHVTLTYNGVVTPALAKGQTIVNTVTIPHYFGLPKVDRDQHPTDAKDYTDANSDTVTLTGDFQLADVAVQKTGTPSIQPGGKIDYDVTVTNNGPDSAANTKLVDTVPAGLVIDASSVAVTPGGTGSCSVSGQIITCTLGTLPSGAVRHVTFSVTAPGLPATQPSYVNTAAATTDTLESTTANNAASFTTTVPFGDVGIEKDVSAPAVRRGGTVDWTLTVTNHGPSTATDVQVTDTLPAGFTATSVNFAPATPVVTCSSLSPKVVCDLPDMAPGAVIVLTVHTSVGNVTGQPPVAGVPAVNNADVTSTNDSNPNNNHASAQTNITLAAPRISDVQIVKATSTPRVAVGKRGTFTLVVKNNGPDDATDVTVVDPLPTGLTFASVKTTQGSCTGGTAITCHLGTIANGKSVTITVTVTTTAVGGFRNTGTVTTSSTDSNPSNNTSSASLTVFKAKARIRLTKLVDKHKAKAGQILHYTVVLRVLSDVAATNVKVCDTIPPHTTFVSAPGAFFVRGQVCWTRKLVKAHGVVRFRITVRIDRDAPTGNVRNTAVATASNGNRSVARVRTRVTSINNSGGVGGVTG